MELAADLFRDVILDFQKCCFAKLHCFKHKSNAKFRTKKYLKLVKLLFLEQPSRIFAPFSIFEINSSIK
jgi:hypothetical protein